MGVGPGVHRAIGACTVTTRRGELAVRPESVEPQVFDNCIADATSSALPPGLQHRQPGRIMDAHERAGRRAHLTPSWVRRRGPENRPGVRRQRSGVESGAAAVPTGPGRLLTVCRYSPSQKQQYGQDEQDEQDKKAATPSCTSCSSCQFWLLSRGLERLLR